MERARGDVGEDVGRMGAPALSVYGSLHLRSAVLAARAGRAAVADDHLRAARETARLLPEGHGNPYGMEFGRANTELHAVSVAVELADGATALQRAGALRRPPGVPGGRHWMSLPLPPDVPPVRAGHHWLEVSRAWFYHGDRRQSFKALAEARKVSPQQVRHHPMARDLVYAIAGAEARPTEHLRSFIAWIGETA
ncbi:hypothetical protein [Streptosporangium sp. KLBMP 9127]|nr:hypothetical protein [Streptosporangium sp. KLBMP 9127]